MRDSLNVSRYRRIFPPGSEDDAFQDFVRNYMRCVASIDRSLGKVLALLEDMAARQ